MDDHERKLVTNTTYARLVGVTPRTIYTWEAKGILSPPQKVRGRKYRDPNERPKLDTETRDS